MNPPPDREARERRHKRRLDRMRKRAQAATAVQCTYTGLTGPCRLKQRTHYHVEFPHGSKVVHYGSALDRQIRREWARTRILEGVVSRDDFINGAAPLDRTVSLARTGLTSEDLATP